MRCVAELSQRDCGTSEDMSNRPVSDEVAAPGVFMGPCGRQNGQFGQQVTARSRKAAKGLHAPAADMTGATMSKGIDKGGRYPVVVTEQDGAAGPLPLEELQMIGAAQLSEILGVSKRQISRWLASGDLPPHDFVIGQTKRWRRSTVRAWIEEQAIKNQIAPSR